MGRSTADKINSHDLWYGQVHGPEPILVKLAGAGNLLARSARYPAGDCAVLVIYISAVNTDTRQDNTPSLIMAGPSWNYVLKFIITGAAYPSP